MAKLPSLVSKLPNDVKQFLERVREALTGEGWDRFVTARDLVSSGIAKDINLTPGATGEVYGTPPAPTNVQADGALANIILTWDRPVYRGHSHAEIWASGVDDLGQAVVIGMAPGAIFVHNIGGGATRYYWVRFVNLNGVAGPYNGTAGTLGQTGQDPAYLLELLTGEITESQLYQSLSERIDLIDADLTMPGSVSQRVHAEAVARANAISAEAATREAAITQEASVRQSVDESLASQISTVSASVAGNVAAIQAESTARANADSAEAVSRETLATQLRGSYTGTDLNALTGGLIYQERQVRSTQTDNLAKSISLLAVGSAQGMDVYRTFYFDTPNSTDGWVGVGLTITQDYGYLAQTAVQGSAFASRYIQVTGLSFSGGKYPTIRLRAKRISGSGWQWLVNYQVGGSWQTGVVAAAQTVAIGDFTTIDFDFSGVTNYMGGTVTGLRIFAAPTSSDRWSFDYVAIGRIGPGASTAMISEEAEARISADEAAATALSQVSAALTTADANLLTVIQTESQTRATETSALSTLVEDVQASLTTETSNRIAAIQTEQTARVAADESLSSRIDVVAAEVVTVDTTLQAAVQGETQARILADSAEAQARSLLAARVEDAENAIDVNVAAIATEAQARADGDGAIASTVTTLQSTVSGNTTSIQTQQATIDGLSAQYTVKIDANGYVSGFGLASTAVNGAPFSEFIVKADRFAIGSPQGEIIPFVVQTTPTTINGESVSAGVYMDSAYIVNGTITRAKIGNAAIDDAKIASLSAAKVTFGEMSGDRITVGSLNADRIKTGTLSATTKIYVGANNEITIDGAGSITTNGSTTKTVMSSGNVVTYLKVGGAEYPYQSLTHVEVGVCQNNTQVTIPGYFRQQPRVLVSPAELGVFNKDYYAQSQTLVCTPGAVSEVVPGSYTWRFTPTATLSLLGTEVAEALDVGSGLVAYDTYTSVPVRTPGNTKNISASASFLSVRGTGTSGSYFRRKVVWSLEYSTDGSIWNTGEQRTVLLGDNVSYPVSDTASTAVQAGLYWWRITAIASDLDGTTFSTGSPSYDVLTVTRTGSASGTYSGFTSTFVDGEDRTDSGTLYTNLAGYTPPSGYSITDVTYSAAFTYDMLEGGAGYIGSCSASFYNGNVLIGTYSPPFVFSHPTFYRSSSISGTEYSTKVLTTYTTTGTRVVYNFAGGTFGGSSSGTLSLQVTAQINMRRPIANSTSAENQYSLIAVGYVLDNAEVLASGTLNWMAVGA